MEHTLQTESGCLTYRLERKKVKNINIRIKNGGCISVSAPAKAPIREIERVLLEKETFIRRAQSRITSLEELAPPPPGDDENERCLALMRELVAELYPRFGFADAHIPAIRCRDMTSRWGSCNYVTRSLTFSSRLARLPRRYAEYVAAHELAHLAIHDHSPRFHALVRSVLPDADSRRAEMKRYALTKRGETDE
ncbi:MAG: YgjP-like metallopeptidase domain-containing protein [Eubacteriales bacterium]